MRELPVSELARSKVLGKSCGSALFTLKPAACTFGLLSMTSRLLLAAVSCCFGLLVILGRR